MDPAPSNNLSWVKAQSGSIEIPGRDPSAIDRPIWFRHHTLLESTSGGYDGGHHNIITSIRLSPPNPSSHELNWDVVKAAVRQLRFDHPAIAGKHGWSAQPPTPEHAVFAYEVPGSESDIDAWLSQVVLDRTNVLLASSGDIERAVQTITYDLGKAGLPRRPVFLLHYIPAASPDGQHALVFYFSHSVFDAVGSFQIMDLCLSKIADSLATGGQRSPVPWGEETSRLPPALVEVARIPHTADKLPEDQVMMQKVKISVQSLPNAPKYPAPHPHSPPSATGLITRILSPDVLTALRTAARAHGSTIFSVLWAALALSSIRIWPPDDTVNIAVPFLYSPIDIRGLACDDPCDRSQWTVRLSLGFNTYVARDLGRFVRSSSGNGDDSHQLAEDIWVLAKEVREQVEEQRKHTERTPVWIDDMVASLAEGSMRVLGDDAAASSKWYPVLSSIGIMDKYLARSHPVATGGQLTVTSPRLSPSFYTGSGFALHAFTWEGELMMAFTFPECVLGSAQDQVIALNEGRNADAIGLQVVNEFMHILDVTSQSK